LDRLVSLTSAERILVVIFLMLVVFLLNIGSYEIVGKSSIMFMAVVLSPYVIQIFLAIGLDRINVDMLSMSSSPSVSSVNWSLFLNTLLWNMTGWDYLGCVVAEVHDPAVNFPLGVMAGVVLAFLNYAVPVAISAMTVSSANWSEWDDGYFLTSLQNLSPWLGTLTLVSAAVSILATANVLTSASSRALWAAARIGRMPKFLGLELTLHDNSKSPITALGLHCITTILLSICGTFQYLLVLDSFITCVLLVLEMFAFLHLKWKRPDAHRPYEVPWKMKGAWLITIPKAVVVVSTLAAQDKETWYVGGSFCGIILILSWIFRLKEQDVNTEVRNKMLVV
jgi:amino acid transporter